MTDTQSAKPTVEAPPAGLERPVVPEPRISPETAADQPGEPTKRRRPLRWITAVLAVLVVFAAGVGATLWATADSGQKSAPQPQAPAASPAPAAGSGLMSSMVMPDFRGSVIMSSAYALRTGLGQGLSIQAPGGAAVQYQTVARQDPAPGTLITPSSVITFWPASSAGSSSSSSYPAPAPGQFTSGTYEVGTGPGEIAPGKYIAPAGSSRCYYARLRDLDGGVGSIIDNHGEYRGGQVILNINKSDKAVEISGDCTFAKK